MPSKSTMIAASPDAIRTRAYLLWEADGRPFGRDDHYWGLAAAELIAPAKPKAAAAKATAPAKTAKAKASSKAAAKPAKPRAAAKPAKAVTSKAKKK